MDLQYEISSKPNPHFCRHQTSSWTANDTPSLRTHFMKGAQNRSSLQVHSFWIYCRDDRPLALLPNSSCWLVTAVLSLSTLCGDPHVSSSPIHISEKIWMTLL